MDLIPRPNEQNYASNMKRLPVRELCALSMRTFIILILAAWMGLHAHAQLDTNLIRDIKTWRKGETPPARLLKFPDGEIETMPSCGLRSLGSEVGDYIWEIRDADLLAALMFDYRSDAETFRAARQRLITLRGVAHVSRILNERRNSDPDALARSELAVLFQLLRSQYVAIQVARIAPEDMQQDKAQSALKAMRTDLQAGVLWADAYRNHSERSARTLICYLYDSTVSPSGFDIVTYGKAETLPADHLRKLFRAKRGTHIFRAADGVYLYHIRSFYDGAR
jgi:hypothetical protein